MKHFFRPCHILLVFSSEPPLNPRPSKCLILPMKYGIFVNLTKNSIKLKFLSLTFLKMFTCKLPVYFKDRVADFKAAKESRVQGCNVRKVNCSFVYSAYRLKPVPLWAEFVNKNRCIIVRLVSEMG